MLFLSPSFVTYALLSSNRYRPLVINHAQTPVCFPRKTDPRASVDTVVDWMWNAKAWMTVPLFQRWIELLNHRMVTARKSILLLVDNAPGHKLSQLEYSNVKIEFLLPNTTSCLQPMDAGIIHSFKASYRRRWVQWRTDEFDANRFDSRFDIYSAVL